MKKYALSFFLLLIVATAMGQKKSIVNLIQSESSMGIKRNGKDVIKVYKGTFQQDYSKLRSDSAYFYPQDNAFEAFGHVNINQGDTLNIYSDKLNYNGNTKVAILTDNVKMVDKDATLTTNYLNYNTATRIGTYTGGGKLVNKDNTLTSKNGYYFAFSRDAYFRYNVVLNSKDAITKTDTLRYNTGSRISYFYGPTHIYGTKDKDTLYTENGIYNTVTEQAFFGKKNLYTQGTKSLKGDSLFYDRIKGYGRAVKHITFTDAEQKVTLKGNLGTYYKADERTVVTQDPYVILLTEEKDTTKTDSVKLLPVQSKNAKAIRDTTKNGSKLQSVQNKNNKALKNTNQNNPLPLSNNNAAAIDTAIKNIGNAPPLQNNAAIQDTTINGTVKLPPQSKNIKAPPYITKKTNIQPKNTGNIKPDAVNKITDKTITNLKADTIKRDTIYMSADTLETQILTYKNLKILQEKQRLANFRDTSVKKKEFIPYKKSPKFLSLDPPTMAKDTSYFRRDFFGQAKPKIVDTVKIKKQTIVKLKGKKAVAIPDSLKTAPDKDAPAKADTVVKHVKPVLSDTSRVRIISAYHSAKIFKSDLQAKADSMFYSNSDSTIRCYVKPMVWAQGSQLSGDTINLQLKNKKLDNMVMYPAAFIVNVEKGDSTHFNQISGKKMRGYFKKSKLETMYVDENAEGIFYSRDSTQKISNMMHSFSSNMKVILRNNKPSRVIYLTKADLKGIPIKKVKEDEKILKGFIWKPKDRPISKESIIPSYNKKQVVAAPKKVIAGKLPLKKTGNEKTAKDTSVNNVPGKPNNIKSGKDSTSNTPKKLNTIKTGKDSTVNNPPKKPDNIKAGKDSTNTAPQKLPAVKKPGKDTVAVKAPVVRK